MTPRRLLLTVACVLFAWGIWGYDLWAPDEPYFAEGAREMLADGQWVVPHVNGVVSTDKPPLFFWLIALISLPFDSVSPVTARLPSVLAALGSLLLTIRLGRRLYNEKVATYAGLLLTVVFLFWDKARSAQTDAVLSFFILVSLSAFEAFRSEQVNARRAGLLFWTAAALGVLTKGPVGILLPLGIVLVTCAWDRRFLRLRHFAPLSGPLVFFAILACWIVPANFWNPELYTVGGALREHFVDRALHGMHHIKPFWYYLKVLPVVLLPWTGLVPGALVGAWRRRSPADRFLLVIVLFIVLFFSISTEKRTLYALPSFPAYALLVGVLLDSLGSGVGRGRLSRNWIAVPQWAIAAVFATAGGVLLALGGTVDVVPRWMTAMLGVLLVATAAATAFSTARGNLLRSVGFTCAGTAAVYLLAIVLVFPALNASKSARAFSAVLRHETAGSAAGREIIAYRLRNLPEAFAFYTDGLYTRETRELDVLEAHLRRSERVYAVIDVDLAAPMEPALAARMTTVATARLSRTNVALVHNGAEPHDSLP